MQISDSIQPISQINNEISASAKIQESTSKEVNIHVESISEIAVHTELGAKETSQASKDLARIASQLQTLVTQFKTA